MYTCQQVLRPQVRVQVQVLRPQVQVPSTHLWYTTWAWGVAYQETTFRTKIGRGQG